MKLRLTDRGLRSLTAPDGKYMEVWDRTFHLPGASFGVRVSGRTSSKTWVLLYNRSKRLVLGRYPTLGLSAAREKAYQVAAGIVANESDPIAEKRARKAAPTVRDVAERFLRRHPATGGKSGRGLRPATTKMYRSILEREILPKWGDRKMDDITRKDVIDLLEEIAVEREAVPYSNRVRATLTCMYNWALDREVVTSNPIARLPKRPKEATRQRVLSDDEVRTLWKKLDQQPEPVGSLFRFLLVTGQRIGETTAAQWGDVKDGVWTIPQENTKADQEHRVPLSPQALAILDELRASASPAQGDRIFPIKWISHATARLREACEFNFRPHDLRRTAATGMSRLGVDRLTIERAQNRTDGTIAGIYDRYRREPEVRAALSKWGAHIEGIVKGAPRLEIRMEGR